MLFSHRSPCRNGENRMMISIPPFPFKCTSRPGLWRRGSSKRELMNLIPQSGKLNFGAPWTKAESLIWSTMAPKRSRWTRWRFTMSVKSRSRSATKVDTEWLVVNNFSMCILGFFFHILSFSSEKFCSAWHLHCCFSPKRIFRRWFLDSPWWRWHWGRHPQYTRVSPSLPL